MAAGYTAQCAKYNGVRLRTSQGWLIYCFSAQKSRSFVEDWTQAHCRTFGPRKSGPFCPESQHEASDDSLNTSDVFQAIMTQNDFNKATWFKRSAL